MILIHNSVQRLTFNHKTICRPFNLKTPLALWNLALAVVSAVGAFRVGAHLLYLLPPFGGYSFRDTICECVARQQMGEEGLSTDSHARRSYPI